jgi:hypothetical protein
VPVYTPVPLAELVIGSRVLHSCFPQTDTVYHENIVCQGLNRLCLRSPQTKALFG